MDLVGFDGMACEVLDGLHGQYPAIWSVHLGRLHDFADAPTYLGNESVRTSVPDALLRSLLHSPHELVVNRVEGEAEGTVKDVALNLDAEIHLHDVGGSQPAARIAWIDRVVRSHLIQRETCGESPAASEWVLTIEANQHSGPLLNHLSYLCELHARPNLPLHVLPDLSVHLCALAQAAQPPPPGRILDGAQRRRLPRGTASVPVAGVAQLLPGRRAAWVEGRHPLRRSQGRSAGRAGLRRRHLHTARGCCTLLCREPRGRELCRAASRSGSTHLQPKLEVDAEDQVLK
mmetsp:Transcript_21475/g.64448  ORF Transcript_21475/g.64448 Transcript_21475/m.64448 type:complete len:289 (+) Transcript_21475:539-1405(+)